MEPAWKLLSVAEFFDACPRDRRRYQLLDGVIVAMAPPAEPHQIIQANLLFELGSPLRANHPGCTLHAEAGIAPAGLAGRDHFTADVVFTCAPADLASRGMVGEPLLIVEILSPSTERDDVFLKLPAYQRIPSVREVLYVESERIAATVHRLAGGAAWTPEELAGPDARLTLVTIGLDIPLAALYRGLPALR
ncbi:MAG TPA: Uma2 family endonuclease [Stellaceae bacterium]|nr:Uma2 family endonuclease [Stellaceae bacterium]